MRRLILAAPMLLFACSQGGDAANDNADREDSAHAHWGYEGEEGPDNWHLLDDAYSACDLSRTDQRQSPVDIPVDSVVACQGSEKSGGVQALNYNDSATTMVDNGHTLQVSFPLQVAENTMTADNVDYQLLQYHLHTPSEHTVDGKEYPLEIHLVHKAADGNLAVLGLFAEVCDGEVDIDELAFPSDIAGTPTASSGLLNPRAFVGEGLPEVYAYAGSLTTPPCSEIVSWYVAKQPICISASQLESIENKIHGDNARRPVASLDAPKNKRDVRLCSPSAAE